MGRCALWKAETKAMLQDVTSEQSAPLRLHLRCAAYLLFAAKSKGSKDISALQD